MKRLTLLRLVPVLCLSIFAGCEHRSRVEDLIAMQYPQLRSGGSMTFVTYDEHYTTKGASRRFCVTCSVKWEKPFYRIESQCPPFEKYPSVIKLKRAEQAAKGIPFTVVFDKGRSSHKSVTTSFSLANLYTRDSVKEELSKSCVIFPDGERIGTKFDQDLFCRQYEEQVAETAKLNMGWSKLEKEYCVKVEKCKEVKFTRLKDGELESHIAEADSLYGSLEKVVADIDAKLVPMRNIHHNANKLVPFFGQFPIQDEAKAGIAAVEETRKLLRHYSDEMKNRRESARTEKNTRAKRGIVFVQAPSESKGNVSADKKDRTGKSGGVITISMPK